MPTELRNLPEGSIFGEGGIAFLGGKWGGGGGGYGGS